MNIGLKYAVKNIYIRKHWKYDKIEDEIECSSLLLPSILLNN